MLLNILVVLILTLHSLQCKGRLRAGEGGRMTDSLGFWFKANNLFQIIVFSTIIK